MVDLGQKKAGFYLPFFIFGLALLFFKVQIGETKNPP